MTGAQAVLKAPVPVISAAKYRQPERKLRRMVHRAELPQYHTDSGAVKGAGQEGNIERS